MQILEAQSSDSLAGNVVSLPSSSGLKAELFLAIEVGRVGSTCSEVGEDTGKLSPCSACVYFQCRCVLSSNTGIDLAEIFYMYPLIARVSLIPQR